MYGGKVKRLDVKMIKDGFSVFLKKSEIFRNGYLKNLKYPDKNFKEKLMHCYGIVPDFMNEIYSFCNGTDVDIIDQRYFDFIPGYRLMKIEEIVLMYEEFHQLDGVVIPFLKRIIPVIILHIRRWII